MDLPSTELIELLKYLLPGFLTVAVYNSLTPALRPTSFERIVQALIYTIVVQVIVFAIRFIAIKVGDGFGALGEWNPNAQLANSVVVGIALAFLLAHLSNHDKLYKVLRILRITHQTSYPSEWYGVLSRNQNYVVLHLQGGRRLYGWPEEWPNSPDTGHFVIVMAEWLLDEHESQPLDDVERITIRAKDVEMLEFVKNPKDDAKE